MATKWKGSYDCSRKYMKSWEKQYSWLSESPDGKGSAYCKLCRKSLQAKIWSISKHESSSEHTNRIKETQQMRPLAVERCTRPEAVKCEIKEAEIQIAVGIACHSAILAIDHLGEIMVQHGKGSILGEIQLHRTKCSQLLKNVVSPSLKHELQHDVQGKGFAVLIDESTDVAAKKNLCICIRYFSEKEMRVATAFVGMEEVVETSGERLFQAVKSGLQTVGLDFDSCFGFASDGASTMVGEWNSVWSRIRQASPNCVRMKCICHSLALCVQHAFEKMPSNLGFLLKEIPKWFSKSILRREAFKQLITVMDPNAEQRGKPMPFQKMSATRWLVRGKVLFNILVNWEELKAYFLVEEPNCKSDVRYKARMLLSMLNDGINYLYFQFLSPIVTEFERVNAFFQATNADPEDMVKELFLLHSTLRFRIYGSGDVLLPTSRVDFGAKFIMEARKYVGDHGHCTDAKMKVEEVYNRCQSFLLEALTQVEDRLPASESIFKGLSYLSPRSVLSQVDRAPFMSLPMIHTIMGEMSAVEEEYRKIIHVDWAAESVFNGIVPTDSVDFWCGIFKYTSSTGEHPFRQLALYALTALATPVSNAICERVFSHVTNVKTKLRNRMQLDMLDAVIRVRVNLKFGQKCCRDFSASQEMLELFNSANVYKQGENSAEQEGLNLLEYL